MYFGGYDPNKSCDNFRSLIVTQPLNAKRSLSSSRLSQRKLAPDHHGIKIRQSGDMLESREKPAKGPDYLLRSKDGAPQKRHKNAEKVVRLNIGGRSYAFLSTQLRLLPRALLGKFASDSHERRLLRCDAYLHDTGEYFWSRSPHMFAPIANFYFSNAESNLHFPAETCRNQFLQELHFWGVKQDSVKFCDAPACCTTTAAHQCAGPATDHRRRDILNVLDGGRFAASKTCSVPQIFRFHSVGAGVEHFSSDMDSNKQCALAAGVVQHEFVEPHSSGQSSIETWSTVSAYDDEVTPWNENNKRSMSTSVRINDSAEKDAAGGHLSWRARVWRMTENPGVSTLAKIWAFWSMLFVIVSVGALIIGSMKNFQNEQGDPIFALEVAEWVCVAWFIWELSVRFIATPNRARFFLQFLNIVDFLSILPCFLELIVSMFPTGDKDMSNLQTVMMLLRILKVLRVSRIFKLGRYSSGMQTFAAVLKQSLSELGISLIGLMTAVIFFATLMFFVEKDVEDTHFDSIPAACWWAVITMTTVGYGDAVPISAGGKLLASATSLSGVLVLAFPVTTIVGNFNKYLQKQEQDARFRSELTVQMTRNENGDVWHGHGDNDDEHV